MMKYLIIWNLIVFFIYAFDKLKAIKHKNRIRENTLITISFFMGSIGAITSMIIFRHKLNKKLFKFNILLSILVNIIFFYLLFKVKVL